MSRARQRKIPRGRMMQGWDVDEPLGMTVGHERLRYGHGRETSNETVHTWTSGGKQVATKHAILEERCA